MEFLIALKTFATGALVYWKQLLTIALIASLIGVYFYIDHKSYTRGMNEVQVAWDAEKIQRLKDALDTSIKNQKVVTDLEETKNANLKEIDRLRANNHALWLRVPKAPCTGSLPTTPSNPDVTGSGELPDPVPDRTEQALNKFDRAFADSAYQADRVVEDCRVIVDWAKTLKRK